MIRLYMGFSFIFCFWLTDGCVSHLKMITFNIGFFFIYYSQLTDGYVSNLSMILFNMGFFLFFAFDSQMGVWVIWQWLNLLTYLLSLVLDKRRRWAEMVASTIAMLISHNTMTKGGGLPWFTFINALPFKMWWQT